MNIYAADLLLKTMATYVHRDTVESEDISNPCLVEVADGTAIRICVIPETGACATFEYTLSDINEIESGAAAWLPWSDEPIVKPTRGRIEAPVTAVRALSIHGRLDWAVRVLPIK